MHKVNIAENVVEGAFRMDFRDRSVEVAAGEFLVVPHGVERKGVPNTGQHVNERTVAEPERI